MLVKGVTADLDHLPVFAHFSKAIWALSAPAFFNNVFIYKKDKIALTSY